MMAKWHLPSDGFYDLRDRLSPSSESRDKRLKEMLILESIQKWESKNPDSKSQI